MIKCLIFDLDDTLYYEKTYVLEAFKHSLLYIIYSLFASKLTKIYYIITFISLNFLIVNSASYSILTFSYTWSPFS